MSGINIKSYNRAVLVGRVVGKVEYGKSPSGREYVRLALETEEYLLVGGQSKVVPTRHDVLITNRYAIPAFRDHLKEGFYISVTGKIGVRNGKPVIEVTDFGHDAQFMYVPPDNEAAAPAAAAAKKADAKGGGFDMSQMSAIKDSGRKAPADDAYFTPDAPMERRGPSKAPEGFSDDEIPY